MAMRRVWVLIGSEPMADGAVTVQIEHTEAGSKPAVYDNFLTAQDEADELNAMSKDAGQVGNDMEPMAAWLVDETGVISIAGERELKIDDLQQYCREQGLV